MKRRPEALIFEKSSPGRRCTGTPGTDLTRATEGLPEEEIRTQSLGLPEVGELDLVRHYTRLSQLNTAITTAFYPLGSCTMKYNPVVQDGIAAHEPWAGMHPLQSDEETQGALAVLVGLQNALAEATGLPGVSLHPAAGAQGELASLMILRSWLESQDQPKRRTILIPDSAHGTNPASCTLAGFQVAPVRTDPVGLLDLEHLREQLGENTAGLMITNPNTLGLFEKNIGKICDAVHEAGGLVYMDGANFNAIVGVARPGDFGVDMMHINLHKTFSTPHGGGGPGAGPICVTEALTSFLPGDRAVPEGEGFALRTEKNSIGRLRAFHGNFGVLVRAYAYILRLGQDGLRRVAENAVLNANYLRVQVGKSWRIPFDGICMHEFVARPTKAMRENEVHTVDVAKRLIDLGFHPPTVYFPLVVPEAIMVEPTETESKETLDSFVAAMKTIAEEALSGGDSLRAAPETTPVGRVDEARAVKQPLLRHPRS